ncbi:MAG: hypothetical protein R3C24_00120 [Cyanobacteriota/Melainabacteria group bacterium]
MIWEPSTATTVYRSGPLVDVTDLGKGLRQSATARAPGSVPDHGLYKSILFIAASSKAPRAFSTGLSFSSLRESTRPPLSGSAI